jgi:hypothetical protein
MKMRYWTLGAMLAVMALIMGTSSLTAQEIWWKEPGGIHMPDFNQNQPGLGDYFCGPTAAGNCLWWFHMRYPGLGIVPPGMQPPEFIQNLAGLMNTDPAYGTYMSDLQTGLMDWLVQRGLGDKFTEVTVWDPTYEYCREQLMACQDVILLVGWWECQQIIPLGGGCYEIHWERNGGHFVTMAGVDPTGQGIGQSDPWWDNAESGGAGRIMGPNHDGSATAHNDGVSASHDVYEVSTLGISPGGVWEILGYPPGGKADIGVFKNLNPNPRVSKQEITIWCDPVPPWVFPGATVAEVEAAAVVCPVDEIPTLTEWGMIIFCVLLFAWMAWVIVHRRKKAIVGI